MKREERNEMIDHRGNEIEQCLQTIEFLSESTEDYLFLWDFLREIQSAETRRICLSDSGFGEMCVCQRC